MRPPAGWTAARWQQAVPGRGGVLAKGADLVIVNKFGKQESYGAAAFAISSPRLWPRYPGALSVPWTKPGFHEFAGDLAEALRPETVLTGARKRPGRRGMTGGSTRADFCPLPVLRLRKSLWRSRPGPASR